MKLAGESHLPPYEIVGALGFIGALLMLLKTLPEGRKKVRALWPKHPRSQFLRALLAVFLNFANVIALPHLPLALFYITVFTAPMLIGVLAAFFLGERLTATKIIAIIVGFIGVIIAIDPLNVSAKGDWIGYVAASAGVVCFAINVIWLRVMTQSETAESLTFFNAFVEMLVGFSFMLWHADPLAWKMVVILLAMGALCIVGNLSFAKAIRATTATTVAQFHYTQLIMGALLGFLIWHDVPTLNMVFGAAIIIAAGLYIAAHARRTENLATVIPH